MNNELKFGAENLARLLRNLENTSYNEGSEALACRLSDCRTVIHELLAERAALPTTGGEVIGAFRNAREALQRVVAQLEVLHEDREPMMAAIIATVALLLSDDLETVTEYFAAKGAA